MKTYKLKNGKEITYNLLKEYEYIHKFSEGQIADKLGISRMGLYRIRRKMRWPQVVRSDKDTVRVDPEDARLRKNAYMREYMRKRPYISHNKELKGGANE